MFYENASSYSDISLHHQSSKDWRWRKWQKLTQYLPCCPFVFACYFDLGEWCQARLHSFALVPARALLFKRPHSERVVTGARCTAPVLWRCGVRQPLCADCISPLRFHLHPSSLPPHAGIVCWCGGWPWASPIVWMCSPLQLWPLVFVFPVILQCSYFNKCVMWC